ncbi:hypothetical protein INT43_007123 [Umbelopsis isabellina]|uniref:Telomere length regulation protein conserved domain-containing protein n=1 Tax=Mortierella isabellina TaxID=91625 RepID=A0A8H7UE03_MORIS|nr:hypothetical protein INT43_007123 [Umbelopsis isabellina]
MEKRHLNELHTAICSTDTATLTAATQSLSEPLDLVDALPSDSELPKWQGGRELYAIDLVKGHFWSSHLHFVLDKLFPSWGYAFEDGQRYLLLKHTFVPERRTIVATHMARQSLTVLLEHIGSQALHTATLTMCLRLLHELIHEGGLDLLLGEAFDGDWRTTVIALVSIPARVANAVGDSTSNIEAWYTDTRFSATIAHNMTVYVDRMSRKCMISDSKDYTDKIAIALGELIGKMIRQGYANALATSLYPILIPLVISEDKHTPFSRNIWSQTMSERLMLSPDLTRLISATIQYLERSVTTDDMSSGRIRYFARGLSAIYFAGEPVNSPDAKAVVDLFWKVAWLESRSLVLVRNNTTRILAALLVYTGGVKEIDNVDAEDVFPYTLNKRSQDVLLMVLQPLTSLWGDRQFVRNSMYSKQISVTSAILVILGYLPRSVIKSEVYSRMQMTKHIHEWFASGNPETTKIGIMLAETLSMIMDDPDKRLDCQVLDPARDKELLKLQNLISAKDALQLGFDEDVQITEDVKVEADEPLSNNSDEQEINPDAPIFFDEENDTSEDDSDLEPYPMEEESEEDQESQKDHNQKLGRPVYAFDLLQYIRATDDPVRQEIGLSSAGGLIRQKAGLGSEIEENAHELAKAIYALHDTFHLQKFDEYQQEAIVALMVAAPEPTYGVIIDEFYDRSSSESQRSLALRCISLSVKELAGWGDSKNSDKLVDGAIDSLNNVLSDSLVLEPANVVTSSKTVGKTRVFSKKSEIDSRRAKPTRNALAGIVSKVIFFPLMQGYWEGTRTGWSNHTTRVMTTQSPHLLSRFIMTLGIVMYYSIHTPELQQIVKEFWDFALSMRYQTFNGTTEPNVVHAALLGINTIVNTSMKDQKTRLITDYAQQLVETRDWVAVLIDSSSDDVKKSWLFSLGQYHNTVIMNSFGSMFSKPTPKEELRKTQREFKSLQRDLQRDQLQLQRQEKQLENEIKRAARQGNKSLATTLAKQLIQVRHQREKNQKVESQISGMSHRTTAMQSNITMSNAMSEATKAMASTSKIMDPQKMQQTMMEFQRQSMHADMSAEMMDEAIDDAMAGSEDEEEAEEVMNQVLDEIGVSVGGRMATVPMNNPIKAREQQEAEKEDHELQRRLEALRNP